MDRPRCRQPLRPLEESAGVLSSAFKLTLAGAMVHPSYGKLEKPPYMFHRHAWQWNVLDIDHIHYAAMDGYLCFNIYKGWMKNNSQVCGSSKEVSAKRKRDKDEVEDVDEDSE